MIVNKKVLIVLGLLLLFATMISIVAVASGQVLSIPFKGPNEYHRGDQVVIRTGKVSSNRLAVPVNYNDLPVCKPSEEQMSNFPPKSESLLDILTGDRKEPSPIELKFGVLEECTVLCSREVNKTRYYRILPDLELLDLLVLKNSRVDWYIDGFPVAQRILMMMNGNDNTVRTAYKLGFPLGWAGYNEYQTSNGDIDIPTSLHNHFNLKISYSQMDDNTYRIIFFEIMAEAVNYHDKSDPRIIKSICEQRGYTSHKPQHSLSSQNISVLSYTYSVDWIKSETPWSNRWDQYTNPNVERQVHLSSLVNSFIVIIILIVVIVAIFYWQIDFSDDSKEVDVTGWKVVHGDVFRPPARPMLFSVLVGSGVQLLGMLVGSSLLGALGFFSPTSWGDFLSVSAILYLLLGLLAGYVSASTYKMFGHQNWKTLGWFLAFSFPGTVHFIFNTLMIGANFSGDSNMAIYFTVRALWTLIALPLIFWGSRLAWNKEAQQHPVSINPTPRPVPHLVWYQDPFVSTILGAIAPFSVVFIELVFNKQSPHLPISMYNFMFLTLVLLIITSAAITIIIVYYQLRRENYNWWWISFLVSGVSAGYMFVCTIFYTDWSYLPIGLILWNLGDALFTSLFFFIMTGAVGYLSSYMFVHKIYSNIKFD